ncbi:hypothetical protein MGYG_03548 [Nannizzia gypsea CBS 118893]|uniref:Uncharacterized protein n=1 Tax=Arthroderma gypseum (strain ATCC MYA-4604 / CBS 118893) TaxID=535722 RepID=E4USH7_ARTGP|nr:hypothetical protein MGYG_03548 [Nannizzia gypsea CBS 118893]EFR00544.1 hypothetical protein MGYG_03548 [Nannizzia gypsea CBS 118893]
MKLELELELPVCLSVGLSLRGVTSWCSTTGDGRYLRMLALGEMREVDFCLPHKAGPAASILDEQQKKGPGWRDGGQEDGDGGRWGDMGDTPGVEAAPPRSERRLLDPWLVERRLVGSGGKQIPRRRRRSKEGQVRGWTVLGIAAKEKKTQKKQRRV